MSSLALTSLLWEAGRLTATPSFSPSPKPLRVKSEGLPVPSCFSPGLCEEPKQNHFLTASSIASGLPGRKRLHGSGSWVVCRPPLAGQVSWSHTCLLQASGFSEAPGRSSNGDLTSPARSRHLCLQLGRTLASPQRAACRFFETNRRLAPAFLDSLPNLLHVSEQQGTGRITISIWLLRPLSLICTGFEI